MTSQIKVEQIARKLLIVVMLLIFGYLAVGCGYGIYAAQECLKAGYPESAFTLDLKAYCISWIDATKVVVPFVER